MRSSALTDIVRKRIIENVFETLKHWMGSTHFLTRTLANVGTEMSFHVLAYSLKRLIGILGMSKTMKAIQLMTYAAGAGLAALAGVLAAPVMQVTPLMGSNLIIIVFAVVVIGGMGSILGSVLTGLALGILEGFTKVFYPEASNIVVFVIMAIVLLVRPAGLFGKAK